MPNTTPDPLKLLRAISAACLKYDGKDMDVDGCDPEPTLNPDGSASLEMSAFIEVPPPPGHRGPGGGRPLGQMTYTVTVVGKFVPFDAE